MTISKNWSYSQLSSYEMCAHAHMYKKIVKLKEEPSWHLSNGNYVHKLAENYLLGKIKELPKELSKFRKEFASLLAADAAPEEEFVFDKDWNLMKDAWKSKDAWLRSKLDARIDNYIVDFKTGKIYPGHEHQGRLYANLFMMANPDVDEVDIEMWYLSLGQVTSFSFSRDNLATDIAEWERRVSIMHNDSEFIPTPHQYCRNCFVKHLCDAYD
ncbi:MAG: hypothetical protein DRQ42_10055 [Gammaproteobacteria bacterium]|nr:MAG: hypothetical protein DRQ42_10055 [Gammaproteobacteria bacterium]